MDSVSDYLAKIGAKGGAKGRGASKRRDKLHYVNAGKKSAEKRKKIALEKAAVKAVGRIPRAGIWRELPV